MEDVDEKIIKSIVEGAKTSQEITEKITNILMESIDKEKLRNMIIEEVFKDQGLRNKIIIEIVKKL
ncbi:MAG: hypothetical protein QXX38_01060 [Candidatus Aenigmatarchaeota archaeon]